MQFAASEHRFQQVARVHCAGGFARTDNQVKFINEQNNSALGFLDFVQYGFQTFLKFALILRARNKRAHIKREYLAVFQI